MTNADKLNNETHNYQKQFSILRWLCPLRESDSGEALIKMVKKDTEATSLPQVHQKQSTSGTALTAPTEH